MKGTQQEREACKQLAKSLNKWNWAYSLVTLDKRPKPRVAVIMKKKPIKIQFFRPIWFIFMPTIGEINKLAI